MKPFREVDANDLDSERIRNELDTYGYVLVRQLLPIAGVTRLLKEITEILSLSGWLLPEFSPIERMADSSAACGDSDPAFKSVYEQIFSLESFHSFAHQPRLRELMHRIVGPQLLIHPKPIGRVIFPNSDRFVVKAHQDHLSIGGDADCFTAWMPLHDCPAELGPLRILESSHRLGIRKTDLATGLIPEESFSEDDWRRGQINAGDVLVFHCLTVHRASENSSSQLRVSLDCRFQDCTRALDPANIVFPGSDDRSWEATYAGWKSEDLKYFWKRLPLKFQPSLSELSDLAQTDGSARMRARYARTLRQLRLQIANGHAMKSEHEPLSQLLSSAIHST